MNNDIFESRRDLTSTDDVVDCAEKAMVQKNWPEAVKHWRKALKTFLNKTPAAVYTKLAKAHRRMLAFDEAEKTIRQGMGIYPNNAGMFTEYSEIAMTQKDWHKAVKRWQKVLKTFTDKTPAGVYVRLSIAHRRQDHFDEAEKCINLGMERHPDYIGVFTEHAEIAMAQMDWPEAVKRWQKALNTFQKKNPPGVYVRLSIAQRSQGSFDRAERVINLGMERHPDYAGVFTEYAEIAMTQKNWPEAVKRWQKVLNTFPNAPPAAYAKSASAQRYINAFDEAEKVIRKGMEKYPFHSGVFTEYAEIAMAQNDWVEATKRWQFFIDSHGNKAPSHAYARLEIAKAAHGACTTDQSTLVERLNNGYFDFVDFGTSRGDSINYAMRVFNVKAGIGIDTNPNKIKEAKSRGFHVINYDINNLPETEIVKFTILNEFLEHVPNPSDIFAFIHKACMISSDFVYIRQPFFDADGYLMEKGLKLFWSDWRGHPNRMTTLDFFVILTKLRKETIIKNFSIHVEGPTHSSSDSVVHPLASPRDQHHYSSVKHPSKPDNIKFGNHVFKKTLILISKLGFDHYSNFRNVTFDKTIYQSWEE